MKVLSLFDGMGCGYIALKRAGLPVSRYYSSEIDNNCIKLTSVKIPEIVILGSVVDWQDWGFSPGDVDIVIGGSPCQGFSSAGKRKNLDDERSALYFKFRDIVNYLKPKYFLLENVVMKKEYEDIITGDLGVEPLVINSSLVSAQNRVRNYWTNIKGVTLPEDRGICLADILEDGEYTNKACIIGRRLKDGVRRDYDRDVPITQCLEVRDRNSDKSNCLTTVQKDNVLTTLPPGRYENAFKDNLPFRYYTLKECCRLQTVPDDYFNGIVSENQAKKMLGNGWTVDVITHIFGEIPKQMQAESKI